MLSKPLSKETLLASVGDALRCDVGPPSAPTEQLEREHNRILIDKLTEKVKALEASEVRFQQLAESIAEVFWLSDPANSKILYVSPAYEKIWGRSCESLYASPRSWAGAIHPEDRPGFLEGEARPFETSPRENTYRIIRPDGSIRWILDRAFPVRDESGQLVRVAGLAKDITERKRAEEALRTSEERYRTLFETMDEGFCVIEMLYDPDGKPADYRFLEINPAFMKQTGLTDALTKTMREMVPDHDAHWFEIYGKVARTGEPLRFENPAVAMHRYYDVFAFRIGGEKSPRVGIIFNDITARKRAETDLLESTRKLNSTIDSLSGFVYRCTNLPDYPLEYASQGMFEIFGHPPEDYVLGKRNAVDQLHPEDVDRLWNETQAGVAARRPFVMEYRVRHANGQIRWVWEQGAAVFDGDKLLALEGFVTDITERKQAETSLREAEARLRLSVTASNIGLWDWNLVTNDVYFSREWKGQLGFTEDEIPNRFEEWESRLHPDDLAPTLAKVRRFIEDPGAGYAVEFRLRHKDGSYRWIFTQAQIFRNEAGQPMRMMGCHIDISKRKRAEEQLRGLAARLQSVREEERTSVAREIHDVLAQDLTALKLNLAWVTKRLAQPVDEPTRERLTEKLHALTAATDASIRTVQKIATQLRPVVLDTLGLPAAIEWQVHEFQQLTGIECSARVPLEEPPILRDHATSLFRILQESLTNVARHAQATLVEVRLTREAEHLVLSVQDNGCGIPAEKLSDPHSIGLAGMRERALTSGGLVEIISSPGEGTTITVRLPLMVEVP